jgi:hypothetical protein
MKTRIAIAILSLMSLAGCMRKSAPTSSYQCVAGPHEKCPSDLWMADYDRLVTERTKYQAPQDVVDRLQGMDTRLARDIPQGYRFDPDKKRFVELTPQVAVPAAPTK